MTNSAGYRVCAGQKFADMEMRAIVAKLLQKFTFELDTKKQFVNNVLLTWTPIHMHLFVRPRK